MESYLETEKETEGQRERKTDRQRQTDRDRAVKVADLRYATCI